jgi:hypothetical protein
MNLEQLTKHQIILLTLLVSFMTSIATGIVTVSLMSQAPPSVSHTINEIVERTVQTIAAPAGAVTPSTTITVNGNDVVTQSIAMVQKSIVLIVAKGSNSLIARGVVVSADGKVVTDPTALAASGASAFEAILPDSSRLPLTVTAGSATSSVAIAQIVLGTSTVTLVPASLANENKLALGQSVIRIGGVGADTVAEGVIATVPSDDLNGIVETTVPSMIPGSLLMTTSGQIIGITTGDSLVQGNDYYSLVTLPSTPAATVSASHS